MIQGYPLEMQNSHPIKHLSMPTSKTLLGMCPEVDSQLINVSKIVLCKTRQWLKFNYLRKNLHTRHLTWLLMSLIVIIPTLILHHIIYIKCFGEDPT